MPSKKRFIFIITMLLYCKKRAFVPKNPVNIHYCYLYVLSGAFVAYLIKFTPLSF
jgi:hypothetical protein